jgi:hypothetical protein
MPTFGIEHFILLVASIVAIYVLAHPINKKTKKDKLTKEVKFKGLPTDDIQLL